MMSIRPSARVFWPLACILLLADCATKRIAEDRLVVEHASETVVEGLLRFTLAYNPGAAFSTELGPYQRWILIALAIFALGVLLRLYRRTAHQGGWHVAGLAMIAGGAAGNMLDRVRSERGVVDFIDLGVGEARLWIFNIADIGVIVGACLLAFTLWRQDSAHETLALRTTSDGEPWNDPRPTT